MSLEADTIIDRRRLKTRLLLWRVVAVVGLVIAAAAMLSRFDGAPRGDHVARMYIDGIILEDISREAALQDITHDDKVQALIVRIDSPGGTVVGGESLYYALRGVAGTKPVVAVMGSTAASAGYMVALAADHLVARQGTVTGSIGVLMQTANLNGLLDKLGIKPETIKSGPLKAQPNPFEPTSTEARQVAQDVVMDMYAMFVDMVAERRNMARGDVMPLADGRIFTGRQALAAGLVDATGGEAQARTWLEKNRDISGDLPVRDLEINYPSNDWRDYFKGMAGKALFSERLRLDGLISLWHPDSW
ncbi:MAG: signal peptide peptidase SppA [Rhodospirillaceae bacterium]|nr:signal peptide peptidase SppA [Rhodospirillaceae bacterium]